MKQEIQGLATNIGAFEDVGMGVLQIIYAEGDWGDLVGTFHVSPGVGPNTGKHSQLYVATASSKDLKSWCVVNNANPYSQSGSMGCLYIDAATSTSKPICHMNWNQKTETRLLFGGMRISMLCFMRVLVDEFQLARKIHPDAEHVQNVGTPSMQSISGNDIEIRCHFSPQGTHDYPARGIASLGSPGGIITDWGSWAGFFDNWIVDQLRSLGAKGKIGGRDSILWEGATTYIFESQLIQDDWSRATTGISY